LPSFDGCSLHAIGKYDSKGECFVRKVYFSSNLKSPFGLQHHDQIGGYTAYTNANDVFSSFPSFVLMQQVQPQERKHCWMWPCNITNAPHANIKASTLAGHWSKSGMTCRQEGEDDGTINDYAKNLAAPTSTSLTSTYQLSVWNSWARICAPQVLGVCAKGACIQVPPWPPPLTPTGGHGGVADSKPLTRATDELESRMTQIQEGEDDKDIPALDTSRAMGQQGQQSQIARDRAYKLNSQVNSFLAVHTCSSQNWMLLNACNDIILLRKEEINTPGRATRKPHERMQGINPNKQVGTRSSELMTSLK